MMNIFHVKHLPIVNNQQLLGIISEDNIMQNNLSEAIGSYQLSLAHAYVRHSEHVFEVMSKIAENKLTTIPVIDDEDNYLGLITQDDIVQYYANSFSFKEPGSILVLETEKRQYSLAEISRLIESENAAVLSSFLTQEDDTNQVIITLKINKQEIGAIIKTLERFEYRIKASFTENEYFDNLKERYDLLMSYLNV